MTTDQSLYKPFRFIDDDGDGQFGLELAADAGIGWQVFGELGYVGNGHDWTRVIRNLLKQTSPQTIRDLKFSSEADFFVVYSRKRLP